MLSRIFLDVDDTLNDFTMHTLRSKGCPPDCQYPDVGYDIVAACNELTWKDWTPGEFWNSLIEEDWADVPQSPECEWLPDECARIVGRENVFICTSATRLPCSVSGKLKWIQRNLPKWLHRQYLITPNKYLLANDTSLLIDDWHQNCMDFLRHGGQAIMVPKPWNPCGTCWNTEEYLRASLGCYSG